MTIEGEFEYWQLKEHVGHDIECVEYGKDAENIAVECVTCNIVMLDIDRPEPEDYCGICGRSEPEIKLVGGICTDPNTDCERVWHEKQHDQGNDEPNEGCKYCTKGR